MKGPKAVKNMKRPVRLVTSQQEFSSVANARDPVARLVELNKKRGRVSTLPPQQTLERVRNRVGLEVVLQRQLDYSATAEEVDLAEVFLRIVGETEPTGRVTASRSGGSSEPS